MVYRALTECIFLVQTLAGTEKNCQEKNGKKKPRGYFDTESLASRLKTEKETGRNTEQIDNRQVFQVKGVGD